MRETKKNFIVITLLFTLSLFFVASCEMDGIEVEGVSTWTSSPSATPTCAPDVVLSTPSAWDIRPRLLSILYDPRSMGDLDFKNNEKTQDMLSFISKVIPNIMHPSDQVALFHLGYSSYEAARVSRAQSYTTAPLLYDTPSPGEPIPTIPPPTITPGFGGVATQNAYRVQSTAVSVAQSATKQAYGCLANYWNSEVKLTATAWDATATAEIGGITTDLYNDLKHFEENLSISEKPYSTDELHNGGIYHGLSFITRVFQAECSKYGECALIIIDDMQVYYSYNQDMLTVDLNKANIFVIMPNCFDMQDTLCAERQEYWNNEFKALNGGEVTYSNGSRAEINLSEYFNPKK